MARVNGKKIKLQQLTHMKASINSIRRAVLEHSNGTVATFIEVNIKMMRGTARVR